MQRILMVFLLLTVFNSFAQFDLQGDHVKIESYLSFDKLYPLGETKLAVKVNVEDSWHINSNKPYEDYLISKGKFPAACGEVIIFISVKK